MNRVQCDLEPRDDRFGPGEVRLPRVPRQEPGRREADAELFDGPVWRRVHPF